jgi:phosphate transport system protein
VNARAQNRPSAKLLDAATRACLTAKDSVYNVRDFLLTSSHLAVLIVSQCERELDDLEQEVDQQMPKAITRVSESTARELLASLRFITELERITDLMLWVVKRRALKEIATADKGALEQMLGRLEKMLQAAHDALLNRDTAIAASLREQDRELDQIRTSVFRRHLQTAGRTPRQRSVDTLLMVQAIERAGDHVTNLAEEVLHFVEHRSVRHVRKRVTEF